MKVNILVGNLRLWVLFLENTTSKKAPSTDPDQVKRLFCSREGIELERVRWDPKNGELCLRRVKPEETPVEARSGTDVQIVRRTWA